MTSDQEVYRKVGRGGAGNYHPASQASAAAKDLEAQVSSTSTSAVPPPSSSTAHGPTRAGRGGAGNYVAPADLPSAHDQQRLAAAVGASLRKHPHPRHGLAGRGGAGNWKPDNNNNGASSSSNDAAGADAEQKEVERRVREEVERGLKMPEQVHHGFDRGAEEF